VSTKLKFTPIPAFRDNYIWLIENEASDDVFLVDPGQAEPALRHLDEHELTLSGVLITHSHNDHIGGINEVIASHPAPVYGPQCERIPQISSPVSEGTHVELWPGIAFEVLEIPGHLDEHVAYFFSGDAANLPAVCAGDTLFSSGCGRMFDGPPVAYKHSLDRLKRLPSETLVYCAHEYTLANLKFAVSIEPDNMNIRQKEVEVQQRLSDSKCSLPTTIASELATNPFLRCDNDRVKREVSRQSQQSLSNELETFTALRSLKDRF
jgi:hydroxyacylglutathione hydrolase